MGAASGSPRGRLSFLAFLSAQYGTAAPRPPWANVTPCSGGGTGAHGVRPGDRLAPRLKSECLGVSRENKGEKSRRSAFADPVSGDPSRGAWCRSSPNPSGPPAPGHVPSAVLRDVPQETCGSCRRLFIRALDIRVMWKQTLVKNADTKIHLAPSHTAFQTPPTLAPLILDSHGVLQCRRFVLKEHNIVLYHNPQTSSK